MKRLQRKLIFLSALCIMSIGLFAQSLDQAKKLYNEGKYEEAKPAFERLVKQTPGNSSYNHWYGVCCFETGELELAEKHLTVAAKRKVQESFRYLGELYIQTYHFDNAIENYKEYINMLTKKKQDVTPYEERLAIAEKAQRMMDRVEDVQVIDSIVVNKQDFLAAYQLSEESGSLAWFDDFFQTNQGVISTVYMNQKGDNIYYAHPDENGNYSIYRQSRLLENWGDEKELPSNINTAKDENFPFVLSDGVTIYYASTGNGSIGGYDLFVTRYNINSETYLTPEQLGMPYNSVYNDYMMVIDEVKGLGWFVSDRYQPADSACIYLFIPNENRSRMDSEDDDEKRMRASLQSIGSTWRQGVDYSNLIELAYQEIKGEIEIEKDFEFVISNNMVYYTLDDIQSPEARSYYQKVVDINNQINDVTGKLDELRLAFTEGNTARKNQLRPTILELENQLYDLQSQPDNWEKKARNSEINYLRQNR